MSKKKNLYEETYRASIFSILGPEMPETTIKGDQFLNIDKWTGVLFLQELYEWSKLYPLIYPCDQTIVDMVRICNKKKAPKALIKMPSMPKNIDTRLAMALKGGAYHESWHTLYSCKRPLSTQEIIQGIRPILDKAKDLYQVLKIALDWTNLIEDIRIERRGIKEFPGTWVKMNDLTDFIIDRELDQLEEGGPAMNMVARIFREFGLGYSTTTTQSAIALYEEIDIESYIFVTEGPLRSHLEECMNSADQDDLFFLRKSLEIALTLEKESENEEEPLSMEIQSYMNGACNAAQSATYESNLEDYVQGKKNNENSIRKKLSDVNWIDYQKVKSKVKRVNKKDAHPDAVRLIQESMNDASMQSHKIANRVRRLLLSKKRSHKRQPSRKGTSLSIPRLVNTALSIRKNKEPVRPFTKRGKAEKEDITAVIILDESSSMKHLLPQTIKLALIMSKLIESLHGKCMIAGYNLQLISFFGAGHFKIEHKIYKDFQESNAKAIENLACLQADGGTPMADGIEFALQNLKGCPDKHQFIINITDGFPSHPLERLDDAQAKCNEQGVHLMAVGLGAECEYIKETFDHHVWSEESHDMIAECVKSIKNLLVGK